MSKYIYSLLIVVLVLAETPVIRANKINTGIERITTNTIPVLNQFTSNTVRRIMQDKDGYLWFGTLDGLYRYDGYRVLSFRSDLNNPELLVSNEISSLEEDQHNNIWIGTRKGLNVLDRETFQITRFTNSIVQDQFIQTLRCTSDGNVWIGIDGNVFSYNPAEKSFKSRMDNFVQPRGGINHIYEDREGDVWVLMWDCGLHCFKQDGTIVHYPRIGRQNRPFRIYQDYKGQYWICTWEDGVFKFYPNDPDKPYVHCPVDTRKQPEETVFFGIVQDDIYEYIWLMSYSGIHAFKYTDDDTVVQVDISHLFKESNNIFSDIMKDNKGNLWVAGFDEGAFSINFDKSVIQNLNLTGIRENAGMTPNINAIYKQDDEVFWLNQTRLGLSFYNLRTNQVYDYRDVPDLKNISFLSSLTCISEMSNNEIWLGSTDIARICIVERDGGKIKPKKTIDLQAKFEARGSVRRIFEDSKNNIWVVTGNCVLIRLSGEENMRIFSTDLNSITDITEDHNGKIWMSCSNKGVYSIELDTHLDIADSRIMNYTRSSHKLSSDNIAAVCCDMNGDLWLGTQEGNIIFYNNTNNSFTDYSKQCNMTGEAIQNLIPDNNNSLWIATNKRIVEYNIKNGASREYSSSDDLIVNSFLIGSYCFDRVNSIMYFGGNQGICGFSPSNFESGTANHNPVVISDVKINGLSTISGGENNKFKALSRKLILSPADRNLEIDFTTQDYTYPEKIIYAFRIKELDKDWVHTNRQFAIYNQLKKGKHILEVKATDENRRWSPEITTFEIYKEPAYYETWWAHTLYMIFAIGILYCAYMIVRNRIRLRQELHIAQIEKNKSEELTQTKLRYFTNISHDLLTPLTVISCLIDDTETVLRQKVNQFDMMRANVNRLKRLLQQVLDFRKMESGNMKLRVTSGDISAFVKEICINNFTPLLEKKKITFVFESVPQSISGYFDVDKIDKTVYNLLSNALKYTPEKGEISVRVKRITKNKMNSVSIELKDTGVGIAPENINNIFTRFYNNNLIKAEKTNGIGLSLTRDLIELHHGSISVNSKVNEGTTFTIEIPISKEAYKESELDTHLSISINNPEDQILKMESPLLEESLPARDDVNLLLVEDNEDILFTLKNILQKHYNVLTATNGRLALEMVQDNDVDIIISDVMMPQMDGMELCRLIKEDINTSHISVLLLTARNSIEDRIECYDAGADGYISKPFDVKLLKARINNFISNKHKKQEEFRTNNEVNISALDTPSLDEVFLTNAIAIIERNLMDTEFNIDIFSRQMYVSKATLYRKIKAITGLSTNEFIKNIRLKHGCQRLKDKTKTISEIAYSVGFSDPRYFASCFKSAFGMTPSEYQKNENAKAVSNSSIVDAVKGV